MTTEKFVASQPATSALLRVYPALGNQAYMLLWLGMMPATLAVMMNQVVSPYAAFTLSGSNGRQLYVPAGFAHGYQTVSEVSVVMYKCSDFYSPDDERVVRWDDDDLAISWPIRDALVSARDAAAPRLRDLLPEWLPRMEQ